MCLSEEKREMSCSGKNIKCHKPDCVGRHCESFILHILLDLPCFDCIYFCLMISSFAAHHQLGHVGGMFIVISLSLSLSHKFVFLNDNTLISLAFIISLSLSLSHKFVFLNDSTLISLAFISSLSLTHTQICFLKR